MKKVDKEFDIDIRVLEKVTKSKLSIAERTDWCGSEACTANCSDRCTNSCGSCYPCGTAEC